MKRTVKSILAIALSVCMILSLAPISVFADGNMSFTFGTGDFNGNVAQYNINNYYIEITVSGADIVNGTVTVPNGDLSNVTFNVGGDFDSSFMRVVVHGINNYRGEPVITEYGDLVFDQLVLPDGELRLEIEIDDGDWYEEHIIHFKDATVIDNDTVEFDYNGTTISMDIVNAELDGNGDIVTTSGNELYNIEFVLDSNFDATTMNVFVLALDGYAGQLFISNGNTASFRSNDENEEDLHFPEEVFISLDSFLLYAIAVDGNGNRYFDGETMKLEPGESAFVCIHTHPDNVSHGVFFAPGFNYGVAGEGNFADSLTSMGFTVQEGNAEDFGYTDDWIQGNYGCLITVPDTLAIGTVGRMPYSLYELPDNFSWADPWANFSWSDTPTVLTNNLYVEVVPTWELDINANIYYPDTYNQNYLADGKTFYIARDDVCFIQVNSDFERNPQHNIIPYFVFNDQEVQDAGFNVWYGDAQNFGFPAECGSGVCIQASHDASNGDVAELRFELYEFPDGADPWDYQIDFDNEQPVTCVHATLEVRDFNPCIYMVDQYGMIYNDGDTIFYDEDEVRAIAFRTDARSAEHGYFQNYIGWDTDVLENAGFTIVNAGPAFMFDDYRDDFWPDDFVIIVSAENLNYGTSVSYDTWLYEDTDPNDFDWETTPHAYETTFNFRVAPLYGDTGDCSWSYDPFGKSLEISGDGAMADYNMNNPAPWRDYDIQSVFIDDGVTHIGNDAFLFTNVKELEIGSDVTSIGVNAFNCCGNLRNVWLPENLISVGAYAFASTDMREVEIPASVTSIDVCAFGYYYDEQADDDLVVDGFAIYGFGGTQAETYANANNITFYDNTVYLSQDGLWKYCVLPDNTAKLYSDIPWGYSYQGNDTVVTIPSSIDGHTVTVLGECSMSNLTFITKIIVPDTVREIGFAAFSGCTNLQELTLPDSIEVIGAQTLNDTALAGYSGNYEDGGLYIGDYLFLAESDYQGDFGVSDGTKLIAMAAFCNSTVERIFLPESITEISDSMCNNCPNLREVEIRGEVQRIGFFALGNCPSLREIRIPASVNCIEEGNFICRDNNNNEYVSLERIFGFEGTYAEQYANELGVDFINMSRGTTGDCEWFYDANSKTLTITGTGAMADYDQFNQAPWRGLNIENLYIDDGVTRIGNDAFMGSNISNYDIPDSITSIGNNAFHSCYGLNFAILPMYLESVGAYAFYNTSLEDIEIPSTVTSIGQCAFGFFYNSADDCDMRLDAFVVRGWSGTEAENYADTNGFSFQDMTVFLSQDGLWKYQLNPDGTAVLTSDIPWGYSYQGNAANVVIPSSIDGHTVVELGACSMSNLDCIESVTVPNTVKIIGFSAFSGSTNLSALHLPNTIEEIGAQVLWGTELYNNHSHWTNGGLYIDGYLFHVDQNYSGRFTVANGTRLMAYFAFGNCRNITSVVIPDSITSIGMVMFYGCSSLTEITIPSVVNNIAGDVFSFYDETLNENVRPLEVIYGYSGSYTEGYARDLGVEFVAVDMLTPYDADGDGVFTLNDVSFAMSLAIGAVDSCSKAQKYSADVNGDGVVDGFDAAEIDRRFYSSAPFSYELDENNNAVITGYTGTSSVIDIVSVIEGHSVASIKAEAFRNNTLLTCVTLKNGIQTLGKYAFRDCTALETVTLPGSLEAVGNYAFYGCSSLETVNMSSGITAINYAAFMNCTSLETVVIPDTVTTIGTYAFKGCSSLVSVTIPASVTSIIANSFANCPSNMIIYGYAGSYAETYANSRGITFVSIG